MKLIVGLGNIGKEYEKTRHNVGFLLVDNIASKYNIQFSKTNYFYYAKIEDFALIKPTTYMNNSGKAIYEAKKKFNIDDNENILVIVDDIYLALGIFRLRKKGNPGGHNGLKSIEKYLLSNEYTRIRVGISKNQEFNLKNFVLGRFSAKELKIIENLSSYLTELIDVYIKSDFQELLNYNSKNNLSYSNKLKELES